MGDDREMRANDSDWVFLRHDCCAVAIPKIAKSWRKDVSIAAKLTKDVRELWLHYEETLFTFAGVGFVKRAEFREKPLGG